ncbi:MAG: hypothetical protein ABIK62_00080 [candidate division WOR-3 bacterium]
MMHAHRIVGRDRAVQEGELRLTLVLGPKLLKGLLGAPELQDLPFNLR